MDAFGSNPVQRLHPLPSLPATRSVSATLHAGPELRTESHTPSIALIDEAIVLELGAMDEDEARVLAGGASA